jgi:Glutamate-cysteine ligase family 2(GCS2)
MTSLKAKDIKSSVTKSVKTVGKSVNKVTKTITSSLRRKKRNLKKLTIGLEAEFFILDKNGKIVDKADVILNRLNKEKKITGSEIVKEVGKSMIEVGSYPYESSIDTMKSLIKNIKTLIYIADEEGLRLCPLGTYPGKFTPQIRTDARYKTKETLLGKKRFIKSGTACGFHLHSELPWGVFDRKKIRLKKLINSKNKESLVNAYNFLIAVDPAITTFMQSSPFYQGKYMGKDSRMIVYRGSQELEYPDALYYNYPQFGGLPSYKHTGTNIINLIDQKHKEWFQVLEKAGIKKANLPKYKSILEVGWTPVKVNAHGTLEQRGMDMNHLLIILSISVLLRRILRAIQDENYNVVSSDIAIKEPFKLDKKTIYIPPDIYVKNELQRASAYKGLDDDALWYYCKRFLSLSKMIDKKPVNGLFKNLEEMIEKRETVSDQIIKQAKKLGHKDLTKDLPASVAAEIALEHSKRLFQEIVLAEKYTSEI